MFKNLILARMSALPVAVARELAGAAVFAPTLPTQVRSIGFVPPREPGGELIEVVGGQWIAAAQIETRNVPGAALAKHVDALAEVIERETGRKPGRKARRELKDQATLELLPQAFPKSLRVLIWFDPTTGLLALDTASAARSDDVLSLWGQALHVSITTVQTELSAATIMTSWLHDQETDRDKFLIQRDCELRSPDESRTRVRYVGTDILTSEVRGYIRSGMQACNLALQYDDLAEFTLTDALTLRSIALAVPDGGSSPADAFDADVALATGTLRPLIADLIEALGGEAA